MLRFDGLGDCEYAVTWTRNGAGWYTAAFETRDEAREFVSGMVRENEGNGEFIWYARRLATLASADFLDDSVPDVRVLFANPRLCCGNGGTGAPERGWADRVRGALLDVIEECRENQAGEAASERLRAMSEAAGALARLPYDEGRGEW